MATDFGIDPSLRGFKTLFGDTAGASTFNAGANPFEEEVRKRMAAMKAARAAAPPVTAAPATPAVAPTTSLPGATGTFASRLRSMFGLGPLTAGVSLMAPGDAGAGSDVITDASTGDALPSGGVQLSPAVVRRSGVPTNGSPLSSMQIASVQGAADDAKFAGLAAEDAAAQKFTDARTARVNAVVEASRSSREAEATAAAQAAPTTRQARTDFGAPMPDFSLGRNFSGLSQLFQQTANFAVARQQANRADKMNFDAEQKASDRILDRDKISATLAGKGKPDFKIASVESGLSKIPVIIRDGVPTTAITADEKGATTTQPVRARPTTATAHAEGLAVIERSPNKVQDKMKVNARLKELGYPPLP